MGGADIRFLLYLIFNLASDVETGAKEFQVFRFIALQRDADGDTLLYLHKIACSVVLRDE
jgi:hypothetical protein